MTDQTAKTGQDIDPGLAKRQRMRSIAIALGLAFMVLLFYAATIVRIGGAMGEKKSEISQGLTQAS
jgi:F0F1-type ATP synthase membrane subunit b/b'